MNGWNWTWEYPDERVWIAIGIAVVLVLLTSYFLLRYRKRFVWRFCCQILAITGLLFLFWRPVQTFYQEKSRAVLLTENTSLDSLSSLLSGNSILPKVFKLPGVEGDAEMIPSLNTLLGQEKKLGELSILGDGLEQEALPLLDSLKVNFYLNEIPNGVHELNWNRRQLVGKEWEVEGFYFNPKKDSLQLSLKGLGGVVDSILVQGQDSVFIRLKDLPKVSGTYLYDLEVKKEENVLESIPLAVQFFSDEHPDILILSSQPSFEIKFLKNQLAAQSYGVAVRQTISKGRFNQSFLNTKNRNLTQVSTDLLRQYDAVILDEKTSRQLPESELNSILKLVNREGLSVLVLLDEKAGNMAGLSNKQALLLGAVLPHENASAKSMISWKGSDINKPLRISQAKFKSTAALKKCIFQANQQAVVAYRPYGLGKIGTSLVQDTYLWVMEGQESIYRDYWAFLFQQIIPNYMEDVPWELENAFPVVDQPLYFRYHNASQNLPKIAVKWAEENLPIPLRGEAQKRLWQGHFWPKKIGWHELIADEESTYRFYVYDKTTWGNRSRAAQIQRNQAYAQATFSQKNKQISQTIEQKKKVAAWPLYLLFLLSMTGLWIERKLRGE